MPQVKASKPAGIRYIKKENDQWIRVDYAALGSSDFIKYVSKPPFTLPESHEPEVSEPEPYPDGQTLSDFNLQMQAEETATNILHAFSLTAFQMSELWANLRDQFIADPALLEERRSK